MKPSRCNNETKWQARQASVIEPAKQVFGERLPGQYVTLCNVQRNEGWYEYKQVLGSFKGFKPKDFIGIDKDPSIIDTNKRAIPDAVWVCERFLSGVSSIFNTGIDHCPSVIYFDTISMGQKAIPEAIKAMRYFTRYAHKLIFTVNIVAKHPYNGTIDSEETLIKTFFDSSWFYNAVENRIWALVKAIEYETGNTRMSTFTFLKR